VVYLDEKRDLADHRRGVLGMGAEREVAVPVGRRNCGEHERTPRRVPHKTRHVAEVVGYQIARSLMEGLTVGQGEEPGEVAEARIVSVHVAPLAQRQHLVDPNIGQPVCPSLYRIENRDRLAVAKSGDEVGTLAKIVQHSFGRTALLVERRFYRRRLRRARLPGGHALSNRDGTENVLLVGNPSYEPNVIRYRSIAHRPKALALKGLRQRVCAEGAAYLRVLGPQIL
jgi:hypothetical protein